jgi:hypothetical protein
VANDQGLLQVNAGQREELENWAQSRTLPAGGVFRARLILALADGMSYREIERQLGSECGYRIEVEEPLPTEGYGRAARTASREQAAADNTGGAGARDSTGTAETGRR